MKFDAYIKDFNIQYYDKDYRQKLNEFKTNNNNSYIEIEFKPVSNKKYWQLKYIWGHLYPDIAFCWGEHDKDYVHMHCKEKFLEKEVEEQREIPTRFRQKCITVVDKSKKIIAYIPSISDLKEDEMSEYITNLENFLLYEVEGNLGATGKSLHFPDNQKEALKIRNKVYD